MLSEKQLIANRENGKLGGVKTEAGKKISKMNATKHGLFSKQVCLNDEDPEEFEEFRESLAKDLAPENKLQEIVTDIIINNGWRLKRMTKIEKMTTEFAKDESEDKMQMCLGAIPKYDMYDKFNRYGSTMEKRMFRGINELQKMKMGSFGKKDDGQ